MAEIRKIADFEDYQEFLTAVTREVSAASRPELHSIVSDTTVCGGAARLVRTRIPVWTLERMRRLGVTEADILKSYPSLIAADLVQAWAYVDRHRDEIERAILENDET